MPIRKLVKLLICTLIVLPIRSSGSSCWSQDEAADLIALDGTRRHARLAEVNPQGQFVFRSGDKTYTLAVADLVRYGSPVEDTSDPLVVTADGSLWVASQTFVPLAIADERASFESSTFGMVETPLAQLRGILFLQPENDRRRDAMIDQIFKGEKKTDVVILENGDLLTGLTLALKDDQLTFRTADSNTTIDMDQVVALVLNPALTRRPPRPDQFLLVGTRDGSRLVLESLKPGGRGVVMKTVGGLVVNTSLANICYVQPLGRTATYLSDIPIAKYQHQPYLSLSWPYQRDRNVLGGRLRCGGRRSEKGIGVHSIAGLTYRLDQPYRRFEAELGIDDTTEGAGSIVLRIYTDDGSRKWQPKFTSDVVRGGQAPTPISVDIRGAKRLSLIVDVADRGDQQDHANLLDARLVP